MKYVFIALLAFTHNITAAQTDVYVQLRAGAGKSAVKFESYLPIANYSNLTSYNAGLNIGYRVKKWHLNIGVSYLRTGFRLNDLIFVDITGKPADTASFSYAYSHLLVPLGVGYEFNTGKKLSIVPLAAIVPTYNSGRTSYLDATSGTGKMSDTKSSFDSLYKRIVPGGLLEVRLQYSAHHSVDVIVTPSYYFMPGNLLKDSALPGPFKPGQRNSAMSVNLGINYWLSNRRSPADNKNGKQ